MNDKGFYSMIIPYGLLNQPFAENARTEILDNHALLSIVDLHKYYFVNAGIILAEVYLMMREEAFEGDCFCVVWQFAKRRELVQFLLVLVAATLER